jgi:hypothetical protein
LGYWLISIYEIVRLAREEAIRFDDDHVGSEHVLLAALLVEPKLRVSSVLTSMGVTEESVEDLLQNGFGHVRESSSRRYSFDISELIPDDALRERVLGLKRDRPITDEMTEILAASRCWDEVTPELVIAEVLTRPLLAATQMLSLMDVDIASTVAQLRS